MWKCLTILLLLFPASSPSWRPTAPLDLRPANDPIISCAPPGPTCAPGPTTILPDSTGRYAPVFPGWGHHHYPVSTTDDSAQYYFDQGLSLYYSYHLTESAASFKEAEQKDSRCAMMYWGEALAMGPYYNSTYTYKMPTQVLPVLDKMNALASTASPREKDLIAALNQRYSTDTTDSHRTQLNTAYAQAGKALITKYPGDNDIKALYIDGVMTEHAWDMWDNKGQPRTWTPELVKDCEDILKSDPDHPAALHYHIHLLEASLHPEATLASADRLKDLMPGVAHMVHMASHSYQRTGHYDKGVAINDAANEDQANYSKLAPQIHLTTDVLHYDAVGAFCGMNGGMFDEAFRFALRCRVIATSGKGTPGANLQYLSMMPEFVLVRMGKWQTILDQPTPDSRWVYASLISHFTRGMAYIRTGNQPAAKACLDSIRDQLKEPFLLQRALPFNEPIKGASVAEGILEGEVLFAQHHSGEAITAFQHAIDMEDLLTYREPKDWPLPARHFAGACLLKVGNAAEAERLYREDLAQNPGNGWSLLGLSQSLAAEHHAAAADDYLARAKAAFAHAEQMPPTSAY
jgi:tetratricopeptide (TPR) repeat protein